MLSFEQARQIVTEEVSRYRGVIARESLAVWEALERVLAQEIAADRDYPPFDRATRDGYAVRAAEMKPGARLRCAGEIRPGEAPGSALPPGTCVQIMTGAAVPGGADAVVMIEHTARSNDVVTFTGPVQAGQNIVPRGGEAHAGTRLLGAGTRLGFAELALAAQVGAARLEVAKRPRVAILSTGDEIVGAQEVPGPFQMRNCNAVSLAAQTRLAGGEPVLLGHAGDRKEDLREKIKKGLQEPILVLSGGVSAGKYDLVENVLQESGAVFHFDAVAMRPGRPTVFGRCGQTLVFGLPGNPVSTLVTFELFVPPAIDVLSGAAVRSLALVEARLGKAVREKPGLTHFLPARVEWNGGKAEVTPLNWQGSGDMATVAQANCFLLVPQEKEKMEAGETVRILLRKEVF
jgi:molybdopterin molybdotransferase